MSTTRMLSALMTATG